MKKLTLLLAFLIAATGAQAQQYSATKDAGKGSDYNSRFTSGVRPSPATQGKAAKPEKLQPVETGVIYEMSEQGFVVIDPTAPPEMGNGQKYLTANPFPAQGASTPGNEASRDFGGIMLYGWDF